MVRLLNFEELERVECFLPWGKSEDKKRHRQSRVRYILGEESDLEAIRPSWAEEACVSSGTR